MGIEQITSQINSFLGAMNAKISTMIPMPAILLLCASLQRPGVSPLRSLSNVCAALEGLGIPTGPNPDGSPNLIVKFVYEMFKEADRALCEDASVQGASEIGSVVSTGANTGGPVMSTNILPFRITGIIN